MYTPQLTEERKRTIAKSKIIMDAPKFARELFEKHQLFQVHFTEKEWALMEHESQKTYLDALDSGASGKQTKNTKVAHLTGLVGEMTVLKFIPSMIKSKGQYAKVDMEGNEVPVHVKSIHDFLHPKWQVPMYYAKEKGLFVFVFVDTETRTGTIYGTISQEGLVKCPIEKNYSSTDNYAGYRGGLVPTTNGDSIPTEVLYEDIQHSPYRYDGSGTKIIHLINLREI